MKLTKEQLIGAIKLKIAQFDEYCGGIDEEYCLNFIIIEKEVSFKVLFTWTYKITTEGEEPNKISKEHNTDDWFEWLQSESLIKLDDYIQEVLETVTKDKVSYESN